MDFIRRPNQRRRKMIMSLMTDKRAYDVSYYGSVVKVHTLLFIKLNEIKKYDLCSMIDEYMQHSEIRKKMDYGNWSALNKGYKQLLHSIDFSKCSLKKDSKDYDRILLDWISHIYVMLQWKYCLSSKEISEKLPSEYLMKLYTPLHEISYPNACEKLYKKFLA